MTSDLLPSVPFQHSAGTYLCVNPHPKAPTLFWASEKSVGPMAGAGSQLQDWKQEGTRRVKLGQQAPSEADAYKLLARIFGATA